ncbi:MAG TPA: folylpolyglutamate synthase/dihydrofolate synthase family protein [Terriglobales bacterium]|nr:folylpolyglutamate synthase/dihydrofolate synthase family protein [Terriglobales bacterium]
MEGSSYQTAVARMYALGHELAPSGAHKFDLAHMRVLLEALDHPEQRFPSVLVAGTNGKGSTSATLASILCASGWRTGLYTSPHMVRINERIRIQGSPIPDSDFAWLHDRVERSAGRLVAAGELPWHPSFFEMITAIAFEHFADEKVDLAVLEVGMGGRLDATNVVEPRVSVITDISLDHQKFLGDTVAEIAAEKAGIIRRGGAVVTLPQQPQANDVIGRVMMDLEAHAADAVRYVPPVSPASGGWLLPSTTREPGTAAGTTQGTELANKVSPRGPFSRYPLEVMGKQILVESPLVGRHQLRNTALAIAAAVELDRQGFPVAPEAVERGIRQTQWPGRFQVLSSYRHRPEYVLDVAHNPAGAWALRSTLSEYYGDRPFTLVFGAMRDKAIAEMAEILFPLAERVIATRADNPRSATVEEIRQAARRTATDIESAEEVGAALQRASQMLSPSGVVVVTGSIYVVGEVIHQLEGKA